MTHEDKDGTSSRVLSTAELDIASRPTGTFGFCWCRNLEQFIAHDFDALKIENGKVTIECHSQPGARPTLTHTFVYGLDGIEHIKIEVSEWRRGDRKCQDGLLD